MWGIRYIFLWVFFAASLWTISINLCLFPHKNYIRNIWNLHKTKSVQSSIKTAIQNGQFFLAARNYERKYDIYENMLICIHQTNDKMTKINFKCVKSPLFAFCQDNFFWHHIFSWRKYSKYAKYEENMKDIKTRDKYAMHG